MTSNRREGSYFGNVDWLVVGIYLLLVLCGWFNIYAAVFDDSHSSILDISQSYGKQIVWIGVSVFVSLSILLIDQKYYHILAYPLYVISIIVLLGTLFLGSEINGAKSWIVLGPVALQPTELVKMTTALALARFMSAYSFNIRRIGDLIRTAIIIGLPMAIVILQHDKGSALVYMAFLIPLFREGLNGWVYVAVIMIVALFILSFVLEPIALLIAILLVCVLGEGLMNGRWRGKVVYLALVALISGAVWGVVKLAGTEVSGYMAVLIAAVLSLIPVLIYAYRYKVRNILLFIALFTGSLLFVEAKDYVFDNLVELHQQKRFLDLLGLESDPQGWGYNVNQSKIAIGSGGLAGKGFLNGTQTKYNFVPEQSTDFIFCTVGEEWGFLGSAFIVLVFGMLIFRLFRMGERQGEPFGRIYCYSAAGIFLFHVVINIGMTIGLMPVIGIPLPFFSYGGSSMLAFTILLFIAIKLDAARSVSGSEG